MFRNRTGLLWAERASGSFWIWAKIISPVKYGIWIPAPSTLLRTGFVGMTIGGASPTLQSRLPFLNITS